MPTLRSLEALVNEKIGAGSVVRLTTPGEKRVKTGLSSGSFQLNQKLSGTPSVGYAWGRIVELYGPEGSGKSTLALHLVHEAQKLDLPCMYVDAEHALDPEYMEAIGIDLDKLTLVQPGHGEHALQAVEVAVESGYKVVIVDSVAALTPKAELEGEIGDAHMGLQARMMGQALRKMAGKISRQKALVVFINQIRMSMQTMGNPEMTPGGKALKFFSSYRLEVRAPRSGKQETKELGQPSVETGTEVTVKIVKNKSYPPFRRAQFVIEYGKGINKYLDAARFLERMGQFDAKNRLRLLNRSYTVNTLAKTLPHSRDLRREVLTLIKELDDAIRSGQSSRQDQ